MIIIKKVEKNDNDAELIMNWRNDPITLVNSFRILKFEWNEFKEIFYNNYFNNIIPPLFAIYNHEKIAFIGTMNIDKQTIEISINIDPNFRGKKLSVPIIKEALNYHSHQIW